jgi:hypothetical protein
MDHRAVGFPREVALLRAQGGGDGRGRCARYRAHDRSGRGTDLLGESAGGGDGSGGCDGNSVRGTRNGDARDGDDERCDTLHCDVLLCVDDDTDQDVSFVPVVPN